MRRTLAILAIAALALLAGEAAAQGTGLIGKGFKAGLGMYKFTGDDVEMDLSGMLPDASTASPDYKVGFAAGGYLTIGLGPHAALQPELLYVQKGAKYSLDYYEDDIGDRVDADITFKLDYVEVPILFKYLFATEGSTRPSLFLGPVMGIKASSNLKVEVSVPGYGSGEDEVELEDIKSLDFGAVVGAGLDVAAGEGSVVFDVRYTLGLSEFPDTDEVDVTSTSLKNSGFMVTVGYGF